jgi:imidazolonepropionase-like amidohydrolase
MAQPTTAGDTRQRIDADLLIPGRGAPQRAASVVLEGRSITYVGPTAGAPEVAGAVHVPVLMPGMWDCHGHLIGLRAANLEEVVRVPPVLAAARATKDAEAALQAGFTSIREAGGIGLEIARAIDEGTVLGPSIYSAGAILSMTGGHGDLHSFPLDAVHAYAHSGGLIQLADGVPECLRAVRMQLRRGAKVIKICASGGVTSELDDPIHQQFSGEEIRAIVEEAARADRIVMAHCHGKAGIMAALEAGCHTIEHGSYLDAEAADLMAERGALLVPTRFIIEQLLEFGRAAAMPDYSYKKLQVIADSHLKAMATAHAAGVQIAVGTDIFMSGLDMPVPWGRNGGEVPLLAAAGLSAAAAIEAATANGPLTLGPQAPPSGVLEVGYDADVIAVSGDPLADPALLGDAANITHVWKFGTLVKSPQP